MIIYCNWIDLKWLFIDYYLIDLKWLFIDYLIY